ncbi:YggT family protein [Ktedonosporobacter rubrisoli]|uniref:YggT family protein n=1 Tax=Ktedonosporobacter rubrisoli TaxID=2509675 RepID=A0A4V0YZY4_KTERU|nr:YggT family protein [Ktedonosporobacter rubrisoli]QBD81331.1 YggT family protein [Ktedonosporobacter rubrisoli]
MSDAIYIAFTVLRVLVTYGIPLIILAMLVRAIASWFRIDERYAIIRFLARITDPFIDPIRRFVPPMGMFDMSFLIAWFMLTTLQILLLQALP